MATIDLILNTIFKKAISDLNKATKGVDDLEKSVKRASKGSDKFSQGLMRLAGIGSAVVMVQKLANAVIKFNKESLEAASRAQELTAKFNVVFGKSAPQATAALEEFGDTVHRSNLDLQEMAADTQNVIVAVGVAREEAADYSVELVKLAVDVAAFNNAQDADVLNAFNSALVGNHIAAKKYGIIINDAALEAELFKMGVEGGTKAASNAQKVQARYNIIMNATADSHGAAAREADSYTNVTKGLEAAILDLKVAVGDQLLPTMTKYKGTVTEIIERITDQIVTAQLLKEATDLGAISQDELNEVVMVGNHVYGITAERLEELIAKYNEENGIIEETAESINEIIEAENNYEQALRGVASAQEGLEKAQQSWLESTANEVVSALEDLELPAGEYLDVLGAIDDVYGTSEKAEQEHKDKVDAIVKSYGETGNIADFKASLQGLKDAELPQTTEALEEARSKAEELYDVLLRLQGMEKITVEVDYVQTGRGTEEGWASGVDRFVVPPGYPNDSFIAGLTSGEEVTVKTGSGGDISNANDIRVYGDLVINSGGELSEMDVLSEVRI